MESSGRDGKRENGELRVLTWCPSSHAKGVPTVSPPEGHCSSQGFLLCEEFPFQFLGTTTLAVSCTRLLNCFLWFLYIQPHLPKESFLNNSRDMLILTWYQFYIATQTYIMDSGKVSLKVCKTLVYSKARVFSGFRKYNIFSSRLVWGNS